MCDKDMKGFLSVCKIMGWKKVFIMDGNCGWRVVIFRDRVMITYHTPTDGVLFVNKIPEQVIRKAYNSISSGDYDENVIVGVDDPEKMTVCKICV